ncbi:MAG: hypothetical protein ABIQ81_08535, partial [Novosphingobium sp.]
FRNTLHDHPGLEQLRQRVIATHHLDAMEAGEIQPYIEHRLALVGWTDNPSFDPRVFAELYAASGGVPRRINQIANRVLLLAAVEERHDVDVAMLGQVVDELKRDGTLGGGQRAEALAPLQSAVALDEANAFMTQPGVPATRLDDSEILAELQVALAQRDAQIAELQQAVIELANGDHHAAAPNENAAAEVAALTERLGALENRLSEQDRTIRHTLTMLIEWIEGDGAQRAAA